MTLQEKKDGKRLAKISRMERELFVRGYRHVAGVDEVGRGPLAGPLVAAAAVFYEIPKLRRVRDSKLVPEEEREALYEEICGSAADFSIGTVEVEELNRIGNIHKSDLLAMKRAVDGLKITESLYVLIDGNFIVPGIPWDQEAIVDGDALSFCIAAASIIAKVTRDRIMRKYDEMFPGYSFSQNKGYGTNGHLEALEKLGPCPVHRCCFTPVREWFQRKLF
ncbi:MAG: ribonuclease HII [Chloroflexi bacterium]|nr:ribonuclease HII [Chloroflexota bacterium]